MFFIYLTYRIKIMDGEDLASDSGYITDHKFKGGRLGVLAFSQKEIIFSDLQYKCNGKFFVVIYIIFIYSRLVSFAGNSKRREQRVGLLRSHIMWEVLIKKASRSIAFLK